MGRTLRFFPTTLKLLNAYDRMDATGASGTNIDGTKGKIGEMLGTICVAFTVDLGFSAPGLAAWAGPGAAGSGTS